MTEKKKDGEKMTRTAWIARLHKGEFNSARTAYRSMGGSASHNGWTEADKEAASKAIAHYYSEEEPKEAEVPPAPKKRVLKVKTEVKEPASAVEEPTSRTGSRLGVQDLLHIVATLSAVALPAGQVKAQAERVTHTALIRLEALVR